MMGLVLRFAKRDCVKLERISTNQYGTQLQLISTFHHFSIFSNRMTSCNRFHDSHQHNLGRIDIERYIHSVPNESIEISNNNNNNNNNTILPHSRKVNRREIDEFFNNAYIKDNYTLSNLAAILVSIEPYNIKVKTGKLPSIIEFLEKSQEKFTPQLICQFIYGLCKCYQLSKDFNQVLNFFTTKLNESIDSFTVRDLTNAFIGLRYIARINPDIEKLVIALISKFQSCNDTFDSNAYGAIFFGLQNFNIDNDHVYQLLQTLRLKIESSTAPLTTKAISMMLHGLIKIKGNPERKFHLLRIVIPKVQSCTEVFSPSDISMILKGLIYIEIDSSDELIFSLLKSLIPVISSCQASFGPLDASKSLSGFQYLKSDSEEVKQLLKALNIKIEMNPKPWLITKHFVDSFGGLKSMTSDCEEIRQLLTILLNKMKLGSIEQSLIFNEIGISKIFLNIQNMKSEHIEVRQLISFLLPSIKACGELFDAPYFLNVFTNNSNFNSNHEEIKQLLALLKENIKRYDHTKSIASVKKIPQAQVDEYFHDNNDIMNYSKNELIQILNQVGTRYRSHETINLKPHYSKILSFFKMNKDVLTVQDICHVIYGLRVDTVDDAKNDTLNEILSLLSIKLSSSPNYVASITNDVKNNKNLLPAITATHDSSSSSSIATTTTTSYNYTLTDVSKAFCSLSSHTNDKVHIKLLLLLLNHKLEQNSNLMTSIDIASVLYGLRYMKSNCEEIRQVLKTIRMKIQEADTISNLKFSALSISRSLYGLQLMNITENEEYRKLIKIFILKILECTESFKASPMIMSLYCIKNMDTNREMRELAIALIPKILSCLEILDVGNVHRVMGTLIKCHNEKAEEFPLLLKALKLKTNHPYANASTTVRANNESDKETLEVRKREEGNGEKVLIENDKKKVWQRRSV